MSVTQSGARGVVAILFADVEGSTALRSRTGDRAAQADLDAVEGVLTRAVEHHDGRVIKQLGDGLLATFATAGDALASATDMQHGVQSRTATVRIKVGIHAGEVTVRDDDVHGLAVAVASRITSVAQGREVLVSDVAYHLAGSEPDWQWADRGAHELKGVTDAVTLHELRWRNPVANATREALDPQRARLVGRDADLAALEGELEATADGRLRVVLLVGDAGIGKTRLTTELSARHPSVMSLTARAYALGATASLGLWVEALERWLRTLDPATVRELGGAYLDDLAALLPSVAAVTEGRRIAEPPRIRLLGGLASLLDRVSRDAPVLLVLDDVHQADGSSWEALNYLARNLAHSRILVVLAARPVELAEHPVATDVVQALEQEGLLRRRPLDVLDSAEVGELAGMVFGEDRVGDPLVDWLMARSKGSPLFTLGLLRALDDEGADPADPQLRELPEDLTERVEARLRALEPAERSVLEMMTVVGRSAELSELQTLTGRDLESLAAALARLVRLRFVTERDEGRNLHYEILHPLYAEAIYGALGGARRRALHRHVGRALVATGRPGAAAAHFARSAPTGDPEAIDALRDALAQAQARELHREALTLLETILELLPADDSRWLEVFDALGSQPEWVVDHRADVDAAVGVRAMRIVDRLLAGSLDTARRGAAKFTLASLLAWGEGDMAPALALAEDARKLFEGTGEARVTLLAENELGYLHALDGRPESLRSVATNVLARGEELDDSFVVLQALCALAHLHQHAGELEQSVAVIERAIVLARDADKVYRHSYLLAQLAWSLALLGRGPEALGLLQAGRDASPAYRDTLLLDYAAHVQWLGGDLRGAVASMRDQLAWTGALSRRRGFGTAVAAIGVAEMGGVEEGRRLAADAVGVFGGKHCWWHADLARASAAAIEALAGDPAAAVAGGRAVLSYFSETGQLLWVPFVAADVAEAACDASDPVAALEASERVDAVRSRWARSGGASTPVLAVADLADGAATCATGDPSAAIDQLAGAAERFRQAGWPHFEARALALLGRARAGRDRAGAREALSAAVERFEACGAVVRRDRARDALGALGTAGRRARRAVSGPEALTPRELEVARLATEGGTAKDIATRLFIGERTVETHLANVYAKLGISSRVELARLAGELGTDSPDAP